MKIPKKKKIISIKLKVRDNMLLTSYSVKSFF